MGVFVGGNNFRLDEVEVLIAFDGKSDAQNGPVLLGLKILWVGKLIQGCLMINYMGY
jgi:hypothetical protein